MHSVNSEVLGDKKRILFNENNDESAIRKPQRIVATGNNLFVTNPPNTWTPRMFIPAETLHKISTMAWSIAPVIALYGRVKSIQSILSKMCIRGSGIEHILDIVGVRVILTRTDACYRLVEQIHRKFTFIESEYNDYIRTPKPSGYQSLHTTILNSGNFPIEIQIRTAWMHTLAENGRAAHCLYKQRNLFHE